MQFPMLLSQIIRLGQPKHTRWYLLLIAILLTSCQNNPVPLPTLTPRPTPRLLRMAISPAALPALEAVQTCAAADPSLALSLVPAPVNLLDEEEFDLAIRLGNPSNDPGFVAALASEEIVIVVHPQNHLEELPAEGLVGLYSREAAGWPPAGAGSESPVQAEAWHYPPGHELRQVFEAAAIPGLIRQNPSIRLAPDPEAMRQAVADSPGAVGYLPSAWVDETVRSIEIQPQPPGLRDLPLLATAPQQPQGTAFDLLVCLQSGAGQAELDEVYGGAAGAP